MKGIICCHVDDFIHAGDEHLDSVMSKLRKRFSAEKVEEKCFDYIGFKVIQDNGSICRNLIIKSLTQKEII